MYKRTPKILQTPSIAYVAFALLAIVIYVCYVGWTIIGFNWKFKYTFLDPYYAPGQLTSDSSTPLYWMLFILMISRSALLAGAIARSTNPKNIYMRYILHLLSLLCLICEIAACAVFFYESRGCNHSPYEDDPGYNFHYCNDFRWCCVYGFNATCSLTEPSLLLNTTLLKTTNNFGCPLFLASGCTPAVNIGELAWNWVYSASLGSTFVFMCLSFATLIVGIWLHNGVNEEDEVFIYAGAADDDEFIDEALTTNMDGINTSIQQEDYTQQQWGNEKKRITPPLHTSLNSNRKIHLK